MKKGVFAIIIGHILGLFYLVFNNKIKIELANFVITFFAFGAAIYAIYYQHQESKQAEKNFQEQFALQKEAALKQETIGAWQVLANKASGNSGKKEAIEFLASQNIPLWGIDMSEKTHGGRVYLDGLFFKDFKGDRSKIDLIGANFSKAILFDVDFSGTHLFLADFSGASLLGANFSGASLLGANFSGANLGEANFLGAQLSDDKTFEKAFIDCYCHFDNANLPLPPPGYKFEIDERTNENGELIYPKNKPDYRYIKLIKLK